jgi:hypothetical protein
MTYVYMYKRGTFDLQWHMYMYMYNRGTLLTYNDICICTCILEGHYWLTMTYVYVHV